MHNVTIFVQEGHSAAGEIVIDDHVKVGANAVIVAGSDAVLAIGRGARIGAGAVVTSDVPANATVVRAPAEYHAASAIPTT